MSELKISISAEPIFSIGGFEVSNTMVVSLAVSLLLVILALVARHRLKEKHPPRWVVLVQTLVESFYEFVASIAPQRASEFFPLVATIFIFVFLGSLAGLLPGAESIGLIGVHGFVPLLRGATSDLTTTLALAIFAMTSVQVFGYRHLGLGYFTKFFNLSNPINFFVGFLEMISELSRTISFAFRLFGNIFAGEVLIAVMAFLAPLLVTIPFLSLEFFVCFIQSLVFATLTLVFVQMATAEHINK